VIACYRLHLLVGEDAMSRDALFQLGMGSVLLNAAQEEETFATRAALARARAFCAFRWAGRHGFAAFAVAYLLRAEKRSRGNRAKALISPAGSLAIP
jgi:hypothetical protein